MLAEPPGSYFFISIATFVACPALTSTSFVCLPSVSCHASTVYLPGGTFSILAVPSPPVTPKNGFGMTATHPSIQLCTSQVSLIISGFSNFSVPHFSVSLFTLSFSTTGAPAYVTVASIVPPPCAPAGPGRLATRATPVTSAIARSVPITLRIALDPPEFGSCPSIRYSHHEQHHRQCEDCDDRRNDETAARLRLLQPQILP